MVCWEIMGQRKETQTAKIQASTGYPTEDEDRFTAAKASTILISNFCSFVSLQIILLAHLLWFGVRRHNQVQVVRDGFWPWGQK